MRISDWSSDVCSSDLDLPRNTPRIDNRRKGLTMLQNYLPVLIFLVLGGVIGLVLLTLGTFLAPRHPYSEKDSPYECGDRQSVVSGKSVSVRVDLGGRRLIKKKNSENTNKINNK